MVFGVLLAVLAAAANAASNVLQRKANREESPDLSMSPRLLLDLARRPVWLVGIVLVIVSFLLMAAALDMGRLSAIQPVLVLELPMTLLAGSVVFRSPMHAREWLAAAAMTLGLAGLIAFLAPSGGSHGHAGWVLWLLGSAATTIAVLGCIALSYTGGPGRRPAMLGVAAGIAFGLTAAYMKGMTAGFHGGLAGILTTWQTYAVAAAGIAAMYLMQNALHAGRLIAAQPGLTLADPAVAMVWGVVVFKESARGGVWLALGLVSGGLLAAGALALARSPLLEGVAATDEGEARGEDSGDGSGKERGDGSGKERGDERWRRRIRSGDPGSTPTGTRAAKEDSPMPMTTKGGSVRKDELPSTLQRSPDKAQRTFAKTHDAAVEEYGEGQRAHQTAYGSLKHSFEKVGDHWEPKDGKGPSDEQSAKGGAGRSREYPSEEGVDANASKAHLQDVARRLNIRGRSNMNKNQLVNAIKKANRRESAAARDR